MTSRARTQTGPPGSARDLRRGDDCRVSPGEATDPDTGTVCAEGAP